MGFLGKKPTVTSSQRGLQAETQALTYLQARGMKLLERNYRTPGRGGGEIDLILHDRDGTLVFVEVRSRNTQQYGGAAASIGSAKQQRIVLAARHYLLKFRALPPCRFDVVLVEPADSSRDVYIDWLKAAFTAD